MEQSVQRSAGSITTPPPIRPPVVAAATPPAMAASMALTPKEILSIILRHWLMITLFTVGGLVIGVVSWFLLLKFAPRYTASTQIEVLPPTQQDPLQISGQQPQKDIYYQFRFTKSAEMTSQTRFEELIRHPAIRETNWFRQFAERDQTGAIISEEQAVRKALKDLRKNFKCTAPRDYNFLIVSMTCRSPQEAKLIVDTAVSQFLSVQRDQAREGTSRELAERQSQRNAIQQRINQLQQSMDTIAAGTRFARLGIMQIGSFRDYMDDKLADIERRFSELEAERGRLESVIGTLRQRATSLEYDEVLREQIEQDPIAQNMRANIARMEPEFERLLARFGPEHRQVKQAQATLEQMKADLVRRQNEIAEIIRYSNYRNAQDQMTALMQQLDTVTRQINQARQEYKDIDRIRTEYARLDTQKQEQQRLLEEMNGLIERLNALYNDPTIHKMRSLGPAPMPLEVSFPLLQLFLPAGFALGLLAGLGLAFAIELLNDLLRTPTDVTRHIKVPLMGMVCHVDDDPDAEDVDLFHIVRHAPYSITSECYRQIRTNLRLSTAGKMPLHCLAITSSGAGDGKTTVAVNLALTLLAEGKKMLLIDANFRRPMTTRLFARSDESGTRTVGGDFGLSNYLMGQCTEVTQIIRPSGVEGLSIIDSGPLPANPADLLSGDRMKNVIDHCKQRFDFIIIDGPAMLVSDAKIIASQADGVLVIFNAATTHRGAAQRILRELREVNAIPVGAVLMGVRSHRGGYFKEIYRMYQQYQQVTATRPV